MPTWLTPLADLLIGAAEATPAERLLRATLVLCSLVATVQLLSMLATRWGDHHATAKSFVLSLVLHLCLGLGWATLVTPRVPPVELPGEPAPTVVRRVTLESDAPLSQPEPGSDLSWQPTVEAPPVARSRTRSEPAASPVALEAITPQPVASSNAADNSPSSIAADEPFARPVTPPAEAFSIPLPSDEQASLPSVAAPEGTFISRAAAPVHDMMSDAPLPGSTGTKGPRFSRLSRSSQPIEVVNADNTARDAIVARRPLLPESRPINGDLPTFSEEGDLGTPQPHRMDHQPNPDAVTSPSPATTTYRLRRIENRQNVALRNGGTAETEQAVEDALAYLARTQEPEGFWDARRHGGGAKETRQIDAGKPPGGVQTETGLTGLALLAFLGAGYTHDEGQYATTVRRSLDWLIAQQRGDGYLGGQATYYDQMYCHGIATYALAEAYGMQGRPAEFPELREAVVRGVWYIVETQNSDGGWRYRTNASLSDMSLFGWQLMALKSAELAGIGTPSATRTAMIHFLKERARGTKGGLAGYKQDSPPSPAMTAEAWFCKQIHGLRRTSQASDEAARSLLRNLPDLSAPDEYYWYYGTLAMFQYGGPSWEAWNESLRSTLLRLQRRGGTLGGSWDPAGPWGSVGGRIYSTALSTLSLEVYYRFLPLYQAVPEATARD